MSFLDDASLAALCRANKRAKKISRNQDQRDRVYKERFERFFAADVDTFRAKKVALFGPIYRWGLFYKNAVTALNWVRDSKVATPKTWSIRTTPEVLLIAMILLEMKDTVGTARLFFTSILHNRALGFDISDLIQHDGKISNGKTFAEELLYRFSYDRRIYRVLLIRHSHKALRIAYTQNPNPELWIPIITEASLAAASTYKADKIVWLAREMDARGDLDARTAERVAIHVNWTVFFEIGAAEISWMRAALNLPAQ